MNKLLFRVLAASAMLMLVVGVLVIAAVRYARPPAAAAVPPAATTRTITLPATLTLTFAQPTNLHLTRPRSPRGNCLDTTTGSISGPVAVALVRTPHFIDGGVIYTLAATLPASGTYTLNVIDPTAPGDALTLTCAAVPTAAGASSSLLPILLVAAIACALGLLLLAGLVVSHLVGHGRKRNKPVTETRTCW